MTRYERHLVNALTDHGIPAMRAPTSGSSTDRDLPDILAGRPATGHPSPATEPVPLSTVWAIEHKSISASNAYVSGDEVDALVTFARAFGAAPYLAARFKGRGKDRVHYLVSPSDCRVTDGGQYAIHEGTAPDVARVVVNISAGTLTGPDAPADASDGTEVLPDG